MTMPDGGRSRRGLRELAALGLAFYVVAVAIVTSAGVALAAAAGVLIPVALPLGLALVAAMAWLPPKAQRNGWAAVSTWLLSTVYLGHGSFEYGALVAVLLLSVAGAFLSPWFLVAVWALHPLWDLLPRDLPDRIHDLPHACLLYDLVVAGYLAWQTRRGTFDRSPGHTVG